MIARGGRIATTALLALALLSAPAFATTLVPSFNLGFGTGQGSDGVLYDPDLVPDPAFMIDVVSGDLGGGIGGYVVVSASYTLTNCALIEDQSVAKGYPYAVFDNEYQSVRATLTISGTLWSPQGSFTGSILEAEVVSQFDVYEVEALPGETNVLFSAVQYFNVTGGELWQGTPAGSKETDLVVANQLRAKYMWDNVWGDDLPIEDFDGLIGWAPPDVVVHFTPEPATMVLLSLGGLSLLRRRRPK